MENMTCNKLTFAEAGVCKLLVYTEFRWDGGIVIYSILLLGLAGWLMNCLNLLS